MNEFRVLFLRELKEKVSSLRPRKGNLSSGIFYLVLAVLIAAAVIVVFRFLLETYVKVKIGYEAAVTDRAREALTLVLAAVGLVNLIAGICRINASITDNRGMNVLLVLPIRRQTVFLAKFAALAVELLLIALVTMIPFAAVFLAVVGGGWRFVLSALLSALVVTVFCFAVSAVLALPVYYFVKWLLKHYLLLTLLFAALMAGAFFVYSQILEMLKDLLETGQIRFVFNEEFLRSVGKLCGALFPFRALADLAFGVQAGQNLLAALLVLLGSAGVAFLVVRFLFRMAADSRIVRVRAFRRSSGAAKCRSPLAALLRREFVLILRSPALAFQFFSTMLALPLMVYVTSTLLESLVRELLYIDCGFEIALLCTSVFSVLTNTLCASNVSREGRFFAAVKVLPVSGKLYIKSKIYLCSAVSLISVLLSSVFLAALGVVGIWQAAVCFLIAGSLAEGMICLATERDLKRPSFGDSNPRAASFLTFWGLAVSAAAGAVSLGCSMYFRAKFANAAGTVLTVCILAALAAAVLSVSVWRLRHNLEKHYEEATV